MTPESPLPNGMLQGNRHVVPHFDQREILYRRVPPECWDEDNPTHPIDIDAIEMPDMSVGRSRFAHPEWLRLATGCDDWAVVGFQVGDIPREQFIDGIRYDFRAVHVPLRRNYPHSEVRAHRGATEDVAEAHVDGKAVMMPDRVHLEWREKLLRHVKVLIRARQLVPIRQHDPASVEPELPWPRPGER